MIKYVSKVDVVFNQPQIKSQYNFVHVSIKTHKIFGRTDF